MSQQTVNVTNNAPRIIGLSGTVVVFKPGEVRKVPLDAWQELIKSKLTLRLLSEGLLTAKKD